MKIREMTLYRLEVTGAEFQAITEMLEFYEAHADLDSIAMAAVRRAFGVVVKPVAAVDPVEPAEAAQENDREETLPERAIRVAQGGRKGRLTR